jgi:predicted lipid-binding transport protein (Tim44 family)
MAMLLPVVGGLAAGGGAALGGVSAGMAAGMGLMTMATLASGVSQYQQGKYNAQVAEQQATAAERANQINEDARLRELKTLQGYQRAATGAAGYAMTGSPLEVMIDSTYQYELDRGLRRYNTDVEAQQMRARGRLAKQQGRMGLVGSILESGGQAFDLYNRYTN